MLATLNLQPSSIELSTEALNTTVSLSPVAESHGGDAADFSAVLRARVDTTLQPTSPDGGFLPSPGNALPPLQKIDITLVEDGVVAENIAATPLEIDTADESPPTAGTDIESDVETGLTPPMTDAVAALHDSRRGVGTALHRRVLHAALDGSRQQTPRDTPEPTVEPGVPLVLPRAEVALRTPELPLASADRNPTAVAAVALAERGATKSPARPAAAILPGEQSVTMPDSHKPLVAAPIQNTDAARNKLTDRSHEQAPGLQKFRLSGSQPSAAPLLAAAAPLASAASSFAADLELASGVIATPVRDAAWGERVSERVLMLAGSQLKTAEIRLTPAELGPLRVHIAIDEGTANVAFQSQHAVTREAIEQALPRLRELLAENGLTLGQSSVSEQGVSKENQQHNSASTTRSGATESDTGMSPGEDHSAGLPLRVAAGLVDTFA